jgi:hypothetical protein
MVKACKLDRAVKEAGCAGRKVLRLDGMVGDGGRGDGKGSKRG